MALISSSFLKILPHQVTTGEAAANTLTLTYADRVEDSSTIAIYYNGQLIENSTVNPTGKFYYSTVSTLGTINSGTGIDSGSTIAITMTRNPSYTAPGYTSGTSSDPLSAYDTFTISYYYVLYTPA